MNEAPKISDIEDMSGGAIRVSHSMGSGDPRVSDARAVVTVLHDGRTEHLPSDVLDVFDGNRKPFETYVNIERDTGTKELGERLRDILDGIIVLNVLPPRGVVDANRLPWCAIPMKFPENATEHVTALLMGIHEKMARAIQAVVDETRK